MQEVQWLRERGKSKEREPVPEAKGLCACLLPRNFSNQKFREKALEHASLPPCGEDEGLRLLVADELVAAGVAPPTLMKAQGFHPAPLDMLKFNPAQQRAGSKTAQERRGF
jgi:hypothetical protein